MDHSVFCDGVLCHNTDRRNSIAAETIRRFNLMRFTDRSLAALPPPKRGQKLNADDTILGFGLRIGTQSKTFVLTTGADRNRITIGRYPVVSLAQAREKAKTIL